jgi:hypothetical protein
MPKPNTDLPPAENLLKAFSRDLTIIEGERAVVAKITTNAVDRDGEVLLVSGCNTKEFEKNPVVFLSHAWADWMLDDPADKLPVAKCVAIDRQDEALTAKTVFASRPADYPAGKEWVPDTLFALYQQGVLNAFSIGGTILESRPATDKDLVAFGANCRRVISKWKLLEYSVAPIPVNQEALALAVSKGLIKADFAAKIQAPMVKTPPAEPPTGSGILTRDETRVLESPAAAPVVEEIPLRVARKVQTPPVTAAEELPARVIHRRLNCPAGPTPPAVHPETIIRRAVFATLAKARGAMYAD